MSQKKPYRFGSETEAVAVTALLAAAVALAAEKRFDVSAAVASKIAATAVSFIYCYC